MKIQGEFTSECMKEIKNFGSTTYVNVCTGSKMDVPWGSFQVFGGVVGAIIIIIFIAMWLFNNHE